MSSPYDPQQPGYQPYQGGYQQGYPAYPPQGYPQQPFGGVPVPEPPPRRPGVLVAAGVLWLLNGAFLLVFGIITAMADRLPGFDEAMRDQNLEITRDQLLAVGISGAVFGAAIIALAFPVFSGATWARIVVIVVALVPTAVLFALVVFPLFTIAASVLQFLPPVTRYVQAKRRATA